jgi:HD-GYP domain-containing protein (c-di-GMP phosphodiesterase class II)
VAEPLPLPPAEPGAEDRALERTIGPQLVVRLHGLLRAARLYSASNEAYQRQLRDLMASVESAMLEDETTLVAMGEYFYLNGVRVKADASKLSTFHLLFAEFERRALGAIRFLRGITTAELEAFLQLFLDARDAERAERLPEQTAESGLLHVVPVRLRDLRPDGQAEEEAEAHGTASERQRARRTFWHAVVGTRSLVLRSARSGRPALRQARRVVQPIVDTLMKNEYSIIGLTALKDHDEYTYAHCVNVSVLSVSMGQALGLPRPALANLGVAALLHDIGKIAVPAEVLHKPGALTRSEWEQLRRHPLEGLKMVARMPGLSALSLDLMRVCFQHHMNMDRSGYPEQPAGRAPAAMARIVAVADYFDAITAHREYRARPLRPHEALRHLMGPDREHFDPAVLWALVRSVGAYPTGTVMRTESDHVVLSVSPNRTDPRRPFCRVLVRPDGTRPGEGETATWDPMPDEERVVLVLEPDEFEADPGELLAA